VTDQVEIDVALVERLIAGQFPRWAGLPVRAVQPGGWDNRTFRLGDELSVRLPSAAAYVPQVEKEHRWLPELAPWLPLPIPAPVAKGEPAEGYPWPWSIYRWLPGEPATLPLDHPERLAMGLAEFLTALYRIDPRGAPEAGPHSFWRGGPLSIYDAETRSAIAALRNEIDPAAATAVWETALTAEWHEPPVWVHGDIAAGNLLVRHGRLSAVIDFGSSAAGDPACDTAIAWTLFSGASRETFRAGLPVDRATWTRGRGWALWKALITLAEYRDADLAKAAEARRVIAEVLSDHH
jgi:aminoglycoside phosphotransferase (APT) family kinase protein